MRRVRGSARLRLSRNGPGCPDRLEREVDPIPPGDISSKSGSNGTVQGINGPSADMHSLGNVIRRSEGGSDHPWVRPGVVKCVVGHRLCGTSKSKTHEALEDNQDIEEGLCPEFEWAAADDGPENITGCQNADRVTSAVDDGYCTDMFVEHNPCDLADLRGRSGGEDTGAHHWSEFLSGG